MEKFVDDGQHSYKFHMTQSRATLWTDEGIIAAFRLHKMSFQYHVIDARIYGTATAASVNTTTVKKTYK